MPSDPALVTETRSWFAKAALDLRSAEVALEAEPPILEDALFHCQQAIEKALKGFLVWHGQSFRRTHSLEEIGEQCLLLEPTLRSMVDQCVPLTEFAWRGRYPGEWPAPSREEAKVGLGLAKEMLRLVFSLLPQEVKP